MYNLPTDSIPLFVPVAVAARLQPWFDTATLDRGLAEIGERRIVTLAMMRGTVATLVDNHAVVMLRLEKKASLHQGFFIDNGHCGLCGGKAGSKGCSHQAALAILSLVVPAGHDKPLPLPLVFADSHWQKLGFFLHDWLAKGPVQTEHQEERERGIWRITPPEGRLEIVLPPSHDTIVHWFLHPEKTSTKKKEATKGPARLFQQLRLRTMNASERDLEQRGLSTIGLERDASFSLWLAQTLYLLDGDTLPRATINAAEGLRIAGGGVPGVAMTLSVPRRRVWEVVRLCSWENEEMRVLPAARECFRVAFQGETRLEVHPCLRRPDGTLLSRVDLAERRFSSAFHLDGEGFLPALRPPDETLIRPPAAASPTPGASPVPLFAFLNQEQTRDQAFTVEINELPAFLASNGVALRHPDNLVDQELLNLRILDLPDRLELEVFEEHDDWCYLSCRYGIGNTTVSLSEILSAQQKQCNLLPGKQWLRLDDSPLSWLHDLLAQRLAEDGSGRVRLTYRELLALTTLIPEVHHQPKNDAPGRSRLQALLQAEYPAQAAPLPDPPPHLRSYQYLGLAWMHRLYVFGIGGLLADDMGLGKTHQALALLQTVIKEKDDPMLVVCPASVLLSWAEKIEMFYPELSFTVYYGGNRNLEGIGRRRLVLTTYGVIRQDLELLQSENFSVVILDEIQYVKNRNTATHRAAAALKGRVKFGLTGTPVENSLEDLRVLFDICLPGLLGSEKFFQTVYERPIVELGDLQARERLSRLIHPFILRRSRAQVLQELPEIIEHIRYCELSDDQIGLYREVIANREQAEEEDSGSMMPILAAITRLKQICSHPCLVTNCLDNTTYRSGKWELFLEISEELMAAEIKFVVFTQYLGMLDMMACHFAAAGVGFVTLRGDMAPKARQAAIAAFNHDPSCRVCCASLLAGGVGIDLTGAQAVIHYDRWWNAAKEEQATSRVHRFGQKRVVQVFRLITLGTLEEKIHHLIIKKRDLAASLINEDDALILKNLDRRQLLELLRL